MSGIEKNKAVYKDIDSDGRRDNYQERKSVSEEVTLAGPPMRPLGKEHSRQRIWKVQML